MNLDIPTKFTLGLLVAAILYLISPVLLSGLFIIGAVVVVKGLFA